MIRFSAVQFCAIGVCLGFLSFAVRHAAANPAVYEVGDDPGIGFNLISWFNFDNAGTPAVDEGIDEWQNAVQSLYNAGFREVSISPVRFFNTSTFAIAATSTQGPLLTSIEAGVVRAKQLGMRVTLNAFVEPQGFPNWRGTYNPQGAAANTFWSDYQNYMVAVAQIAEAHNVEAMTVGTEYNAIDQDPNNNSRWNTVINAIAAVYEGQLGYSANWDHYNHSNVTSAVWEHPQIDFIGIDAYFNNMVTAAQADASGMYPNPTFINTMTNAWNNKLNNEILPFAAARKGGAGMPVAFTEIGHLPRNRTSLDPQQHFSGSQPVDTGEQIMAFQGLINALDGDADVFHAFHIWQWAMPGSDGSLWNIDPTLPANQPNNVPLGQWLSQFVGTSVRPLAGDYNRDGRVDAADYVSWRDSLGSFVANFGGADGSGNGIVDEADFGVWRANFGASTGSASAGSVTVPEPASAWLTMLALCALIVRRATERRC